MILSNQLKVGSVFDLNGSPHLVLEYSHVKTGRGGATIKVKIKNLEAGTITLKSFNSAEKLETGDIERKKVQFLYGDASVYNFMDNSSYEQFELNKDLIGDFKSYLKEGLELTLLMYKGSPISLELPIKIPFKVIEAEAGIKGDRANPGTKKAVIETGLTIQVPLFIKVGDNVIINTQEGAYVERAK